MPLGFGLLFGLAPAFGPVVFLLELLVAALQAFIFTVLSALYIGMAVEDHDHDHAHNDHDSAGKDTIVA